MIEAVILRMEKDTCMRHAFGRLLRWSERVGNKAKLSGLIAQCIWGPCRENRDSQLKITPPPASPTLRPTCAGAAKRTLSTSTGRTTHSQYSGHLFKEICMIF